MVLTGLPSPQRWARTICGPGQSRHETASAGLVVWVLCGAGSRSPGPGEVRHARYGLGWLVVAVGPDERGPVLR